jgi:hypothetical protein
VKTEFVGWFDIADQLAKGRDKGQLVKEWADSVASQNCKG